MIGQSQTTKTRVNRPLVGIPSFLRAPICEDPERIAGAIAIMGVPFDEGSPFLAGSRCFGMWRGITAITMATARCNREPVYCRNNASDQSLDNDLASHASRPVIGASQRHE